jgi:hypothetical protein
MAPWWPSRYANVNLPQPRDQTATKEMPEFVKLRAEVSRLVRSHATSPALPSAS